MSDLPNVYQTAELENGRVSIVTKKFPHHLLGEGTVVVRPGHIGVCRADVKEVIGSRDIPTDRGPIFGHELVGPVVFAGARSGFQVGELVTFNPNITPDRTTGFAEYVFVHGSSEQLDQAFIRVPEHDIARNIWMPEPMACIVHATRKLLEFSKLSNLVGKKIGIIGAGCSGIMFALYAKHLGASIGIFNRGKVRRDFALDQQLFTEEELFSLDDVNAYQSTFDIVMVVSTIVTPEIQRIAADLARNEGTLLIYGGTREGDKFLTSQVDIDTVRRRERIQLAKYQEKELHICGAYGCYKEDYEESFRLRADYPDHFPLDRIVSEEVDLDGFAELVMGMASGGKDYPGKVVVRT